MKNYSEQEKNILFSYCLILADTALIHGQRLAELCSKGPELEIDIALSNLGLDYLGQARLLYPLAASLSSTDTDEDRLAFFRHEREFRNCQLVELPNSDFSHTVCKQYLLDEFQKRYLAKLAQSVNDELSGIAEKAIKENAYHLKFSRNWILRLGDGTEESHLKTQRALETIFPYSADFFVYSELEEKAYQLGWGVKQIDFYEDWLQCVSQTFDQATLKIPERSVCYTGGKMGIHTEYLGHLLAEMQYMQRSYPDQIW